MSPTQVNTGLGTFLTAQVIAKALYYGHWYQHRQSDLTLGKLILARGEMTEHAWALLHRSIYRQECQLICIKHLAKTPLVPVAVIAAAYNYFRKS